MAQKKAKIEAEWDEDLEKKLEAKANEWSKSCSGKRNYGSTAGGGAVYGIGLIGALIYFFQNADGFLNGLMGVLKAIVWPGYVVYYLLQFLNIR